MKLILPAVLCAAPLLAGLSPSLLPAADYRPEVPQPDLGTRYTPHHSLLAYGRLGGTSLARFTHVVVVDDGAQGKAWQQALGEVGAAVLDTSDPILDLSPGGENPVYYGKEDLKVSGLVPTALEAKLQQTAYALRERLGQGTVILVAGDPVFRGQTPFTRRLLHNAIFFGAYRPSVE